MKSDQLNELCKKLHLSHLPESINSIADDFDSKEEWLISLLESEINCRRELKKARLYKQSKIPTKKSLEDYEWHNQILLPNPNTKEELTSLSFIRQKENAVFVGTPGTGKTHLACALGRMATQAEIETRFWRVPELVTNLEYQWRNNTLETFKKWLGKNY
ncbi:MAG: ATP-binding protein [Liquorilactobacillus ghanensis]|uniref:ATP-binding protein n=1 Tax=Liquorilactobacillus ghanensis TaxID=399370 RepID=UPI0039EBAF88